MQKDVARRMNPRKGLDIKHLLQKTSYSLMAKNWRNTLLLAAAIGLLCSLVYIARNYYENYTSAWASISIVYPEIANGTYPDGSRFTLYSLANEDNVSAVLEQMQAEGKYTSFTSEDLMRGIRASAIVDSGVKETVTSMQSEGNNYSYFASEYELYFTQPRDKQNFILAQLFEENHSAEFLTRLIQLDKEQLQQIYGGLASFQSILNAQPPEQLDYPEWIVYYSSSTRVIKNYLLSLNRSAGNYHAPGTGKSVSDLINLFNTMGGERLDEIDNYIQNSGLAVDRESLINKLTVQIENETLKYSKALDKAEINGYAKDEYDHTFTENLIIVATSEDYGLYQARPKTVFDTVVNQYNDALISSIEYAASIKDMKDDLALYQSADEDSADYRRMDRKCRELIEAYEADYAALCATAQMTVEQYLEYHNNDYMDAFVKESHVFGLGFLIKAGAMFAVGGLVVIMGSVILSPLRDALSIERRRRQMRRIHQQARRREAAAQDKEGRAE